MKRLEFALQTVSKTPYIDFMYNAFMKILLLEDDPILSEIIEEFLVEHGLHVKLFFDGKEALDAIFEDKFDILVLDINVPSLSGFELLKNAQKCQHFYACHLHYVTRPNQRCEKRVCVGSGGLPQKTV